MSPIKNHPLLRYIGNGKWRVEEPIFVDDPKLGEIAVPQGFVSDLDSVPRWLPLSHALVKGASVTAAVVHDYAYRMGHIDGSMITRRKADDLFLRTMIDETVPWWKRRLLWLGVRLGGSSSWRKHRRG